MLAMVMQGRYSMQYFSMVLYVLRPATRIAILLLVCIKLSSNSFIVIADTLLPTWQILVH